MARTTLVAGVLCGLLIATSASAGAPLKGVGHKQNAAKCAATKPGHAASCPKAVSSPKPAARPSPTG